MARPDSVSLHRIFGLYFCLNQAGPLFRVPMDETER